MPYDETELVIRCLILQKLFQVGELFFGSLLTLVNNIRKLMMIKTTDLLFEFWQNRDDLCMMHSVVECECGFQNVVS